MKQHMQKLHNVYQKSVEKYQCALCDYEVSSRRTSDYKTHCFAKHSFCVDCNQTFDNRSDTIDHMDQVHRYKVKCDREGCDFKTIDMSTLR